MSRENPFHALLQVPEIMNGPIITERVACRDHTRLLKPKSEPALARKNEYRHTMLHEFAAACASDSSAQAQAIPFAEMLQKFVALADALDKSKAVAFLLGTADSVHAADSEEKEAAAKMYLSPPREKFCSLRCHDILHPLLVALVAFRLGGPVNATFSIHEHEWKLPVDADNHVPAFYSEGDTADLFDEFRITVVWEMRDDKKTALSGTHSVFLSGDAVPRPVAAVGPQSKETTTAPITIVYSSGQAALYYDSVDPDAVRKSISADFHLNTLTDEDIRLVGTTSKTTSQGRLSLTELVTSFPIEDYNTIFHNLLFDTVSLDKIVTALSTLTVPPPPPPSPDTRQQSLELRFEQYKKDNWAHLPPEIKILETDIHLRGIHATPGHFLQSLVLKARRDIHLPIGMNLFPQNPLEETIEPARKFIRDLPEALISRRIANYASALIDREYTAEDLLSPRRINQLAQALEHCCLQLISTGFIHDAFGLPSIAALARVFGAAIDGIKEVQMRPEPWIEAVDLNIYRTRCLYLFWCVDWLVCYLLKPLPGPCMTVDVGEGSAQFQVVMGQLRRARGEYLKFGIALLRNWVAWGLLVDSLPQGGFTVRRGKRGERRAAAFRD
ncbi:hypothetical protein BDW02DRAFT_527572 [Decorospora gaudefroyi]|uniref:Uncharacterized protein n=1 Tax=Decorospora gaudefroyi TaxID=184978 RepID=A0A6A5KG41_9PLEO|nr:hypothetical protein BDW02DRAFT_527572 [Decorospora gaudefroyi]